MAPHCSNTEAKAKCSSLYDNSLNRRLHYKSLEAIISIILSLVSVDILVPNFNLSKLSHLML